MSDQHQDFWPQLAQFLQDTSLKTVELENRLNFLSNELSKISANNDKIKELTVLNRDLEAELFQLKKNTASALAEDKIIIIANVVNTLAKTRWYYLLVGALLFILIVVTIITIVTIKILKTRTI